MISKQKLSIFKKKLVASHIALLALFAISRFSIARALPEIHIHYAFNDPKVDPVSPLNIVFNDDFEVAKSRQAFKEFAKSNGFVVREFIASTVATLQHSLEDPRAIGVIWAGHSITDRRCTNCDSAQKPISGQKRTYEFINGHLRSASNEYLPRHIFTSRTKNLKWIAPLSCNLVEIWSKYKLATPRSQHLDVFLPDGILSDVTLPAGLIDTFSKVREWIAENKGTSAVEASETGDPRSKILKVRYRDLYSNQYTYEVLANGVFVGELHALISSSGLRKKTGVAEITIAPALIDASTIISIIPNDIERTNPYTKHPIDNILIDEVSVDNVTLLDSTVNIGDADADDLQAEQDTNVKLYQRENLRDLQSIAPISSLDLRLSQP